MSMYENSLFEQAKKELAYLSGEPNFREMVQRRVISILDENTYKKEARDKGLVAGQKKAKKEIAKKLLKMHTPIEKIVEITELTETEIKRIAQ